MSQTTIHEIVPNADTIIYLRNPCAEFADWVNVDENDHSTRSEQSLLGAASSSISNAATLAEHGKENGPIDACKVRFQVCAGVLMSASPWFNRILKKDGWMESCRNREDRRFHISAEDWDEEAFVILMNIFHLRYNKVPRAITLEMLAKIAVLADYYECDESIQLLVGIWVADLKITAPIPKTYCRDLILWMWISWAFRLPELFKVITTVVIKQSVEPVRTLGLPIPDWITEEINLRRCQAFQSVISGLDNQIAIYRSPTYSCPVNSNHSFRCGSMLLGTLLKEMDSRCPSSPGLMKPYFGQKFDAFCNTVRTIRSEAWLLNSYESHFCNLSTAVVTIVDAAVTSIEGLSLSKEMNP
ncbi:hypothetical protein DE146DRAFT_623924 [Phaeosphaeria sp. MPI-PUGE-AT-0046c]|nr:hypothetical protein DE146DRAFT_623924 [Phaeosphaeria sp. MPI-PUGE-AT-0046c]